MRLTDDPFLDLAEKFRLRKALEEADYRNATRAFPELLALCENGIEKFYGDVRQGIHIRRYAQFGFVMKYDRRKSHCPRGLIGPLAKIEVFQDGRVLWTSTTRWIEQNYTDPTMKPESFDAHDLAGSLSARLFAFFLESEENYTNSVA